jgi:hypothetical protein
MRILVTGSARWTNRAAIGIALARLFNVDNTAVLVSGHCPTGADRIAEEIWSAFGGEIELHPANWKRYGRAAGPIRNQEMVDAGADYVLAFPMEGGKGTQGCMELARKAGLRITDYSQPPPRSTVPEEYMTDGPWRG